MQYKGHELKPLTERKVWDEPHKMLCWDEENEDPEIREVVAFFPEINDRCHVVCIDGGWFAKCAEIPEESKPRKATWKELAYWLMDGKGLVVDENTSRVDTGVFFNRIDLDAEVSDNLKVIRRDDTEWHEPTVDYMGLEA